MQLTIIFRNQTQVDLATDFSDDEMKTFLAAAKTRRAALFDYLFIDFSEVIFYSFSEDGGLQDDI